MTVLFLCRLGCRFIRTGAFAEIESEESNYIPLGTFDQTACEVVGDARTTVRTRIVGQSPVVIGR